jgi:hypothetical protein
VKLRSILAEARRVANTPVWGKPRPRRSRAQDQRGFIYLLALAAVMIMLASTLAILEVGATQARRNREEEMIWRGNQYKRAIRLYYHKTGKYPQTLDDLVKGLPQLHFLRQEYKDPTNKADGSWRFIYVNAAGAIIGSTKYATLQQMQILDMNGGVMPAIPGQPGVAASSLAGGNQSSFSGFSSQTGPPQGSAGANGSSNSQSNSANSDGSNPAGQSGSTDQSGGQNPAGGSSNVLGGDNSNSQNPQGQSPNPQNPNGANPSSPFGGNSSSPFGSGGTGQIGTNTNTLGNASAPGLAQANLTALAQLKPTGPVDGPVLGGFLTGVGGKTDAKSIKAYHGAKKLNEFEFIWNPLEDAAAALQNQMSNMQGNVLGQGLTGSGSSANGSGTSGFGSAFGNNPSQNPTNQPSQPQTNPTTNPQQ